MTVKNVVFIKVHKCSSTSVKNILLPVAKKHGLKLVLRNREASKKLRNQHGLLPYTRSTDDNNNLAWHTSDAPYNSCLDHHAYDPLFYEKLIKDPIYITFLRDPLDRAISAFYSPAVPPHGQKLKWEDWYKENINFLNSKPRVTSHCVLINNFMSYMLGYNLLEEITAENLKKRYAFIGFTEYFDESIEQLASVLGWELNAKIPHIRKNFNKPETKLSQDFIELFRQNNKLDYKLYETATQLFANKKGK